MKTLLLFCVIAIGLAGCQTPEVKHAEAAAKTCAKAELLQPVEGEGISLLEKVGAALLGGAGKSAFDDGLAQARADLKSLPATLEPAVVDCAIKAAIAAYQPTTSQGFAGGDPKLVAAASIGRRLLAERASTP